MLNPILSKILTEVSGKPFKAKYLPTPVTASNPKPAGCSLPDFVQSAIDLKQATEANSSLDCDINFIPTPLFVTPYTPSWDDLTIPCPDGFNFETEFGPAAGEDRALKIAGMAGERTVVDLLNILKPADGIWPALSGIAYVTEGYSQIEDANLPELEVRETIIASGAGVYTLTEGLWYLVICPDHPASHGVTYNGKVYYHGQSFKAIATALTASRNTEHTDITVKTTQRAGIELNEATPDSIYLKAGQTFNLVNSSKISDFRFRRLVVGSDRQKPTNGSLGFIPATNGCGGKIIGEININPNDMDVPCADGFNFDAGYSPSTGETITYTKITSEAGYVVLNSLTKTLLQLIPNDGGDENGKYTPVKIKPRFRVTWTSAEPVTYELYMEVNDITIVNGVQQANVSFASDPAGAGIVNSATFSDWYLERIIVRTSESSTKSTFNFVQETCGGKLQGDININAASLGITTPCTTALSAGNLVYSTSGTIQFVDYNTNDSALGDEATLGVSHPTVNGSSNTCQYGIGLTPATFTVPKIMVTLYVRLPGQTLEGATKVEFGGARLGNVWQLTGNLDLSSLAPSNPGDEGGAGPTVTCVNCSRWA